MHIRRGKHVQDATDLELGPSDVVKHLKVESDNKFLGVRESTMQDEKLSFQLASKTYFQRLSIIWTTPLSDTNRVKATNQFALPADIPFVDPAMDT